MNGRAGPRGGNGHSLSRLRIWNDEHFGQESHRNEFAIRSSAVSAPRRHGNGGYARHLPPDRSLDHSQRLAHEAGGAARRLRARGPRRSGSCGRGWHAPDRLIHISEAAQTGSLRGLRSPCLSAGSEASTKDLARAEQAPSPMVLVGRCGCGSARTCFERDYSHIPEAAVIQLRWCAGSRLIGTTRTAGRRTPRLTRRPAA
jgi:hypothetical protein